MKGYTIKKIIATIIVAALLLLPVAALAEGSGLDFSSLNDEQLQRLIDAAQAEMEIRKGVTTDEAAADETALAALDGEAGALEEALAEQPLYVSEARFTVQSEEYKLLYPDVLQAILVNNSEEDIKNAVVAFAAWDANNLPVMLKAQFDFNAPTYIKKANYNGINMVPGSTFGENSGMKLDESVKGIVTLKAVAVSYETFDGTVWENPLFNDFVEMYEGKKLQ